ncbi:MAG TPA: hypothetical protein VG939_06220 [Caulobacteraceae bacterium]|nr:hypothetical protein [Caulobacteraceae bacterium]
MASIHPEHVDKGATEARQARRGRHAFWILAVSTVLAGTATFVAWLYQSGRLESVPQPSPPPAVGHSYPGKAYNGHAI